MDAVTDPSVDQIVVMKSAQVGYTEVLNNVIGFHVDQDPCSIMLVQPSQDAAEDYSRDRLAPMIRDTPCLRSKFESDKARSSSNTLRHKKFPGGLLALALANSPASLSSKPIRVLLCDEVDKYKPSGRQHGDPIAQAKKRTQAFWNRKTLIGGTPTIKGSSRIEAAFGESDQRFFFVPCPYCDAFQRLTWPNVRWPDAEPESAVYVCQACGKEILDAQKRDMLARGEWRSTKPFNGIAGFHISELYSPFSTWPAMAVSFLREKKLPETFQDWINEALGETWEQKGDTVDPSALANRRESYTRASLPPGALMLTVGTDVQEDRLESTVWAFGADEEMWRVEHVVLPGDPGQPALWADHDELLRRRYPTDDGRVLGIEACCVDSGGHFTEQVYRYCAKRKRFRVWAIRGVGGPGRLIWPKRPGRGAKVRVNVWSIGVDTIKELIYGRLNKVLEPGPGYLHFDADCDDEWLAQLTSETVVLRQVQSRRVRVWKPKSSGVRQEALDATNYAYAAMIGRGGAELLRRRAATMPREQLQQPAPASEREPELEATAIETQVSARRAVHRPVRRNWITGFRGRR